jgi:hypothetical protein
MNKLNGCISLLVCTSIAISAWADPAQTKKPREVVGSSGVEAFLAFYDQFVGIVDSDQNNCEKMANELDALLQANKDVLAQGREASARGKVLPTAAQQHIAEASKKIGPGAQKCGSNQRVIQALQQLQY